MFRVLVKIVPKAETHSTTYNDLICYIEGVAHLLRNERLLDIGTTGKLFETMADLFSYLKGVFAIFWQLSIF